MIAPYSTKVTVSGKNTELTNSLSDDRSPREAQTVSAIRAFAMATASALEIINKT